MKWYKMVMVLGLILLLAGVLKAKTGKTKPDNLEIRVERLEDYKANIDNLSKAQAENLKTYVDAEVKKGLDKIDEAKKTLDLLVWVGIPATILAILAAFFTAMSKARKLVTDRIESIVEGKREQIIRLIETEAFDNKLRNTKDLLIISGNEESQESLKKFMEKLKFKRVTYRIAGSFNDTPSHDLMIFNNADGSLSQETIDQLMQNSDDEDDCFVAYTTANLKRDPRLNFSNSRFTLYHSILSTLKYSEIARLTES